MESPRLVRVTRLARLRTAARTPRPRGLARPHALLVAGALGGLAACAPSILPVVPSGATRIELAPRADTLGAESAPRPTTEVRYYAHSPTVAILGWDASDAAYGLNTVMRADGSLLLGAHRLYVSTYAVPVPAFTQAGTATRPLVMTGRSFDARACSGGRACTPPSTFGVRVPDEYLRTSRDSLAVTFYDRWGRELLVTVPRDVIDAYLGVVDSVAAHLRRKP